MYAPQYPFAPGPNAPPQQQQQQQPGYIHNPAAQPSQIPQQQQMMYNQQGQQQYGGMPMGGGPQQQPQYGSGMSAPTMVPNQNAVMMQNGAGGMPHMAAANNGIGECASVCLDSR